MSLSKASKTKLICLALLLQSPWSNVSGTSTTTCSSSDPDLDYSGSDCAHDYTELVNPYLSTVSATTRTDVFHFLKYLRDLPDATYNWYTFWEATKQDPDISHCNAIQPIPESEIPSTNCLCQLNFVCDDICDDQIQEIWIDTAHNLILEDPYKIPYEFGATTADCSRVLSKIASYKKLCGDTEIYQVIEECANGTPNPATPPVNTQSTPSPTTSTTSTTLHSGYGSTASPTSSTTAAPIATTPSPTEANVIDTPSPTSVIISEQTTTLKPTPAPIKSESVSDKPTEAPSTTYQPTSIFEYPYNYQYGYGTSGAHDTDEDTQLDIQESFGTPSTTLNDSLAMSQFEDSHPFANLLLVSLIILGFCVFVAWYAKKNQITSDDGMGREDDNGYLWGLNKSSPSSAEQNMMGSAGMDGNKRGRIRHKKLSDFDDGRLDQRMKIQMTMNEHNDDLLAITPDHIGRLQTRGNDMSHLHVKSKVKMNKKRTKRKGKGGAFQQLNDDDEQNDEDDYDGSTTDSEDGVDMMKMRDDYYASQTFSKKLVDTLGDIHDTVKVTAAAVKTKLSKKEQTVVVPMQIKAAKKEKKKKYPFTIVEDDATTDGFDLSDENESSGSEDPVEVRMNIHGRKIKQPMALPTFDEEEQVNEGKKKKRHKKKKKRKREKKKRRKKEEKKEIVT
eukprot:243799_1